MTRMRMTFKTGDRVSVGESTPRLMLAEALHIEGRSLRLGTVDAIAEEDNIVFVNLDSEEGEGKGACVPVDWTEVCLF